MSITRRELLKAAGSGALLGITANAGTAQARPNKEPPLSAVGMLYDATLGQARLDLSLGMLNRARF